MQFILGIIGLSLSFLGSGTLVFFAAKTKEQILSERRQRIPVMNSGDRKTMGNGKAYDKALLDMPEIKAALKQAKISRIGLVLLTLGFAMQICAVLVN